MKKTILAIMLLALSAMVDYCQAQEPNLLYEPGKLIIQSTQALNVHFFGNTGIPSIDSMNIYYGVTSVEQLFTSAGLDPQELDQYNQIGLGRIYILTMPDSTDILAAMEAYKNLSTIEFAEPDCYLKLLDVYPCDEYFLEAKYQWGLWNDGSFHPSAKPRADVKAPEAWQIEKGDTNLIVGIVDTGIDMIGDFYELRNRVWVNWAERNGIANFDDDGNGYVDDSLGWNFVTNTPFVQPDVELHGTMMAAIIGSETDSSNYCRLIAGVNWECKLMNLKTDTYVIRNDTMYIFPLASAVAEAILYATNNGAKVINLSLGYPFDPKWALPESLKVIGRALNWAYLNHIVSVAAMGNGDTLSNGEGLAHLYPASSPQTLAVGATRWNDDRVTSYYGWQSSYGGHIDLVAPGLSICWGSGVYNISPFVSGTSASTAIVSGIASLVISHRKKLVPGEVLTTEQYYEVLRHTADDTVGHTYTSEHPPQLEDQPCFDIYYGWGRANAFKALVAVSHGDVNNDSQINVLDVNYLIDYLLRGGPPPVPVLEMGDANCDKKVSVSDAVYLINYLFKGGAPLALCYTDCSQP